MKEKKTFGDLKIGDSIYLLSGLEVKELKIMRITSYETFLGLETDGGGTDPWYVGKSGINSYENTIFVDPENAKEVLMDKATRRYSELLDKIDQEIIEFDKLEKFLSDVKEKKFW